MRESWLPGRERWRAAVRSAGRVCAGACLALASASAYGDGIVLVDESARQFNPSAGESATFAVEVPAGSESLEVRVHAADGAPVRTLTRDTDAADRIEIEWDGRDDDGEIVPDEAYGLYLLARGDDEVELATLDLRESDEAAGGFAPGRMSGDLRIEATLERAARVQVRIGIESGPLLRTLDDWRPRVAGRFTVPWDGFDQSGAAYVADDRGLKTLVSTRELPPGALLTFGNVSTVADSTPASNLLLVSTDCAEDAAETLDVLVRRATPDVRIEGAYEVAFYVDHEFVSEEERGYLPMRWRWDAGGTPRDRHLLTVNLLQFGGDILLGSAQVDTTALCVADDQEGRQ